MIKTILKPLSFFEKKMRRKYMKIIAQIYFFNNYGKFEGMYKK